MLEPALLDAGARAFQRWGYHGATAERIAGEAGLSRVTLHRRRITKDVIVAELTARAVTDYRERMWPVLTGSGSGAERLQAALEALCQAAEAHMGVLLALREQSDAIFHDEQPEALTRTVFTEPLEHLLREGLADGSLRSADPLADATVLFNLVGWTYVHMRTGHHWPPDRAGGAVVRIALHGVRA